MTDEPIHPVVLELVRRERGSINVPTAAELLAGSYRSGRVASAYRGVAQDALGTLASRGILQRRGRYVVLAEPRAWRRRRRFTPHYPTP
jgi:hypothetical protein